jgi:putative DNA primase/helicase
MNWDSPGWKDAAKDHHRETAKPKVVVIDTHDTPRDARAKTNGADIGGELTEDALALRFSERHADDLRYVATKGTWLKWDGIRWYPEATHLAFDLARQSCRADAKTYGNGKPPANVYSAKTIAAVERMAKADRRQASTIEEWDADKLAFTTEAETLNLHDGESHAPRPSDYITKKTGCAIASPGAPHPLWTSFLERIAPDAELRAFLQRFVGYSLTGQTGEHKFVFAYGTGANGKSTFTNTIAGIFGDYATVADMGTFIAASTERHPTDVAKLHGYRLVIAQETEKGRRWDETKIKSMTGGDKMTARFMRCDFFDFVPQFKLWIVGNHKPRLDNVDEAMRRRMLLVPFTVQIPEEERDPDLPQKLRAEWPAILRWVVDGCLEWQRIGLAPPKIVTDATDEYFDDQDVIKQWIEDRIDDGGPYAFTSVSELFASWKAWCDERGMKSGMSRTLADTLVDKGYTRKKGTGGVRGFRNLVVK